MNITLDVLKEQDAEDIERYMALLTEQHTKENNSMLAARNGKNI